MIVTQLVLGLDDEVRSIPWGGRSPRDLTRIQIALSLKRERQSHEVPLLDPSQYYLFEEVATRPEGAFPWGGAPSLLPL